MAPLLTSSPPKISKLSPRDMTRLPARRLIMLSCALPSQPRLCEIGGCNGLEGFDSTHKSDKRPASYFSLGRRARLENPESNLRGQHCPAAARPLQLMSISDGCSARAALSVADVRAPDEANRRCGGLLSDYKKGSHPRHVSVFNVFAEAVYARSEDACAPQPAILLRLSRAFDPSPNSAPRYHCAYVC